LYRPETVDTTRRFSFTHGFSNSDFWNGFADPVQSHQP
jgi:hypothetical protein